MRNLMKLIFCGCLLITLSSFCFAQKLSFAGSWVKWSDKRHNEGYLLTLKQKNGIVSGHGEAVTPKEVELQISSAKVTGNTAIVKVKSDWGGTATIKMTRRGNKLYWKALNYKGDLYFLVDTVFVRDK